MFNNNGFELLSQLKNDHIHCNDVILPGEFNPHNVRLFVICHEFAPVAAVWAYHEQAALDAFVDLGYETFKVYDPDPNCEDYAYCGDASEPQNLDTCHIVPVEFNPAIPDQLSYLLMFAEQRHNDNLAGHNAGADRRRMRNQNVLNVVRNYLELSGAPESLLRDLAYLEP